MLKDMTAQDLIELAFLERPRALCDVMDDVNARKHRGVQIDIPVADVIATTEIQAAHKATTQRAYKKVQKIQMI